MEVGVGGTAISCQALEAADLLTYVEDWRRRRNRDRTPKEREDDLIQIRRAIDLQEMEFAETAAAFADHPGDDASEAADFIRHECRMATGATWTSLAVGRQLQRLPKSVAAVEDGEIGYAHLAVVGRTVDALGKSGSAIDEEDLLNKAKTASVGRLWYLCQDLRHAIDQERFAFSRHRPPSPVP